MARKTSTASSHRKKTKKITSIGKSRRTRYKNKHKRRLRGGNKAR